MSVSYDVFAGAFLSKITEYTFIQIPEENRTAIIDGYLKRALPRFAKVCKHDLTAVDEDARAFSIDIPADELDEIVDIVSEGMLEQWMKPYVYRQENLENMLNTFCVRFQSNLIQQLPTELLEPPYSFITKTERRIVTNGKGLKTIKIGQSAAKPRTEEGSTTIPAGSRDKRPEVVGPGIDRVKI